MPNPASAAPIALWIVEDDPLFREMVERVLQANPAVDDLRTFGTCEAALEALAEGLAPEVVLMDLGLPGLSGIEGIRRILAVSPRTHLIVLSVYEDNDRIFEALCAGASGYLLKPSSARQIVEAVQAACGGGAPINPHIASKVLHMFTSLAVPRGEYDLTEREREILHEMVGGLTKQRIADKLFLSYHTVDMHVRNIYAKLHVHSRSGAVAKALRERLL